VVRTRLARNHERDTPDRRFPGPGNAHPPIAFTAGLTLSVSELQSPRSLELALLYKRCSIFLIGVIMAIVDSFYLDRY
jgi:hypothetical protein